MWKEKRARAADDIAADGFRHPTQADHYSGRKLRHRDVAQAVHRHTAGNGAMGWDDAGETPTMVLSVARMSQLPERGPLWLARGGEGVRDTSHGRNDWRRGVQRGELRNGSGGPSVCTAAHCLLLHTSFELYYFALPSVQQCSFPLPFPLKAHCRSPTAISPSHHKRAPCLQIIDTFCPAYTAKASSLRTIVRVQVTVAHS